MVKNQASNEDAAYEFLERHEDIWTEWFPPKWPTRSGPPFNPRHRA